MRKLGWYALRLVVIGFILCSLLLLAANLYVQSHGVQQRIRDALSARLKMPVGLKKTTVTPWEGLRLDGVTLSPEPSDNEPGGKGGSATDFLTAASFRVRFAWWPLLFKHEVVIEQVLLDRPRVTWQQNADGHWELPFEKGGPSRKKNGPRQPGKTPPATPPPGTPGPTPTKAQIAEARYPALKQGIPVAVGKMRLRHGAMDLLNRQRVMLARLDEVNLDGHADDAHHATGAFWFGKASAARTELALTNYRTDFAYDDRDGLTLRDGRGEIADGELRTHFHLQTNVAGWPFDGSGRLENVNLARLIPKRDNAFSKIDGRLFANLDLSGVAGDPDSRAATGRLWLEGGQLQNDPILQLLGQLLAIKDLSQLQFKQAQVDYRLQGSVLHIDPLVLSANDLQLTAHGRYLTAKDQLELHARLIIDQAVCRQLPKVIESNFTLCGDEAPGSRYVDFDVTGKLDDPKVNLYEKIMAGSVPELITNLLAPKSKAPKPKNGKHKGEPLTNPPPADAP